MGVGGMSKGDMMTGEMREVVNSAKKINAINAVPKLYYGLF